MTFQTFEFPQEDPSEFNGDSVIPCAVATAVVSTLFVALRLYSRAVLLRVWGWEDVFILVALCFAWGTSVAMGLQLRYGLGSHMQFVLHKYFDYAKAGLFTSLTYSLSLTFTKISILCLYIRILTYRKIRLMGKILMVTVIITHAWIIASILTTCVPLNFIWDWTVKPKYCHHPRVFWANAGLNMTTDFLIFLLPITVIRKLRIGRRQKWGLYAVFLLAFGVCIISLVRMIWLLQMQNVATTEYLDMTWTAVKIANWTMIEVNVAIVCACLTTLRPILNRYFPGLMHSQAHSPTVPPNHTRPMVDIYDRPLTVGTRPSRPPPVARPGSGSFIVMDEAKLDGRDLEAALLEHHTNELDMQRIPITLPRTPGSIGVQVVPPPPQARLHGSESHDSLFRCSSRAVSHHKGV